MTITQAQLLKSQKLSRGLRQLKDEYRAEGRPNVATTLTHVRILLESNPELGAKIYDIVCGDAK